MKLAFSMKSAPSAWNPADSCTQWNPLDFMTMKSDRFHEMWQISQTTPLPLNAKHPADFMPNELRIHGPIFFLFCYKANWPNEVNCNNKNTIYCNEEIFFIFFKIWGIGILQKSSWYLWPLYQKLSEALSDKTIRNDNSW